MRRDANQGNGGGILVRDLFGDRVQPVLVDRGKLGKTIAAQNFVDNLGQLAAGMMVFSGVKAGLDASGIFLFLSALLALVVTVLKVPPPRPATEGESLDPDL